MPRGRQSVAEQRRPAVVDGVGAGRKAVARLSCRTSGGQSVSRRARPALRADDDADRRRVGARVDRQRSRHRRSGRRARQGWAPSDTGRAMIASPPRGLTTAAALRIQRSNSPSAMTCACVSARPASARSCAGVEGRVHDDEVEGAVGEAGCRPRLAGQRDVGGEHRGAARRDARCPGCASVSARKTRHVRRVLDQHDLGSGQRDATARPGRPAPAPKSASLPAKPDGTAAASIMASMPARWPRAFRLHQPEIAAMEGVERMGRRVVRHERGKLAHFSRISLAMPASARMRRAASDLVVGDHHAARQDADRAVKHAHVLVGHEAADAGVAQQRFDEGDDRRHRWCG